MIIFCYNSPINFHLYHYAGNSPIRYVDPNGESISDWVHVGLDIVGFVPVVGDIADGVNAVIYLCEGDYGNAALSAASMIPVVGDAVSKGGKAVKAAIKHSDDIVGAGKQVLKHADNGLSKATKAPSKIAEAAESATAKVVNGGKHPNGIYEKADYHGKTSNSVKNKAPNMGQEALDNSVPIGSNTTRRVGISDGEIVVFDETSKGIFHGHVRSWDELNNSMKAALRKAGMVNNKGKIQ